jgi:hypothetical protein
MRGRYDRYRTVVEFTTTCVISAYHHYRCEFEPRSNKLKVYRGKYSRGHKQDCQNQERLPVSEEDLPSFQYVRLMFMVFNATFNNISVISWRSVLLVEKIGGPGENHRPVASH